MKITYILATQYGLKLNCLQKYANKLQKGHKINYIKGRRTILQEKGKKLYNEFIDSGPIKKITAKCKEKRVNLAQKLVDSRVECQEAITKVSERTGQRVEEEFDISTAYAEKMTQARINAISDLRNFVKFTTMLYVMTSIIPYQPGQLHLNLDAMQFTLGCDFDQKVQIKYVRDERTAVH